MTARKRNLLITAGVTLLITLPSLFWWRYWREQPEQKVPRLLAELRDRPGRMEFSLRSLYARDPEKIQKDLDALGASAVPALIDALEDVGEELPTIRNLAAQHLGKLKDPRAVEPLIKCLKERPVRVHFAFQALVELKDVRAVEPLLACLKDGDYYLKANAVGPLGALGDRRAFEALVVILEDEKIKEEERKRNAAASGGGLRSGAAVALGQLGDARAFDVLMNALKNDEDPGVKAGAAQGLGWLGDRRAIPALTKANETPLPNAGHVDELRRAARDALEMLRRN